MTQGMVTGIKQAGAFVAGVVVGPAETSAPTVTTGPVKASTIKVNVNPVNTTVVDVIVEVINGSAGTTGVRVVPSSLSMVDAVVAPSTAAEKFVLKAFATEGVGYEASTLTCFSGGKKVLISAYAGAVPGSSTGVVPGWMTTRWIAKCGASGTHWAGVSEAVRWALTSPEWTGSAAYLKFASTNSGVVSQTGMRFACAFGEKFCGTTITPKVLVTETVREWASGIHWTAVSSLPTATSHTVLSCAFQATATLGLGHKPGEAGFKHKVWASGVGGLAIIPPNFKVHTGIFSATGLRVPLKTMSAATGWPSFATSSAEKRLALSEYIQKLIVKVTMELTPTLRARIFFLRSPTYIAAKEEYDQGARVAHWREIGLADVVGDEAEEVASEIEKIKEDVHYDVRKELKWWESR